MRVLCSDKSGSIEYAALVGARCRKLSFWVHRLEGTGKLEGQTARKGKCLASSDSDPESLLIRGELGEIIFSGMTSHYRPSPSLHRESD